MVARRSLMQVQASPEYQLEQCLRSATSCTQAVHICLVLCTLQLLPSDLKVSLCDHDVWFRTGNHDGGPDPKIGSHHAGHPRLVSCCVQLLLGSDQLHKSAFTMRCAQPALCGCFWHNATAGLHMTRADDLTASEHKHGAQTPSEATLHMLVQDGHRSLCGGTLHPQK